MSDNVSGVERISADCRAEWNIRDVSVSRTRLEQRSRADLDRAEQQLLAQLRRAGSSGLRFVVLLIITTGARCGTRSQHASFHRILVDSSAFVLFAVMQ